MTEYDGYRIALLTFSSIATIISSIILSSVVYRFFIVPCNRSYRQRILSQMIQESESAQLNSSNNSNTIQNNNTNNTTNTTNITTTTTETITTTLNDTNNNNNINRNRIHTPHNTPNTSIAAINRNTNTINRDVNIQDAIENSTLLLKISTMIALVSLHQGLIWYFIANIALHTDVFDIATDVNEDSINGSDNITITQDNDVDTIDTTSNDDRITNNSDKWFDIARVLSFIFWFAGYLFIFIVLLARLHEICKLSHYKYPKIIIISLIIMIVLIIISFTMFEIEYETKGVNYRSHIVVGCIVFGFILSIIYSISIISLFIHRLFNEIMARKSGLLDCERQRISNEFISFNRRQIKLIEIITKYSVLSFIMIVLCLFGLIIYAIYFGITDESERTIEFDMVAWSFLGLNLLLNNVILWFYLPFANVFYKKLCKPLHFLCNQCIVLCSKYKQIQMENKQTNIAMTEINGISGINGIDGISDINDENMNLDNINGDINGDTLLIGGSTKNKKNTLSNDINTDYSSTEESSVDVSLR